MSKHKLYIALLACGAISLGCNESDENAAKAEAKPAAKVEAKAEAKPAAKPAAKAEAKPAAKPVAKPAAKAEVEGINFIDSSAVISDGFFPSQAG